MIHELFTLLPLRWGSGQVSLCVSPLQVQSRFPTALQLFWMQPHWFSKPNVVAAPLPDTGHLAGGAQCESWTPSLILRKDLWGFDTLPACKTPHLGCVLRLGHISATPPHFNVPFPLYP